MTPPILEQIKVMVQHNWLNTRQIQQDLALMTRFQRRVFESFATMKSGVGKLTESQVFTWGKTGPSVLHHAEEKADMQKLIDQGLVELQPGLTVGHNRYYLTHQGVMVMCFAVNHLAEEVFKVRDEEIVEGETKPVDYSGMTTDQILASIPEPHEGRVLPPDHILRLLNGYKVESERPYDQELIDAVWGSEDNYDLEDHG